MTKPICTVMVGLPGLGKSYHVDNVVFTYGAVDVPFVYSTDAILESVAKFLSKTYNEVFEEHIKSATAEAEIDLADAIKKQKDVIWDQTNLGVKKREKIINRMKQAGYDVDCICIMPPDVLAKHATNTIDATADYTEWENRLNNRPGKVIPPHIMDNMKQSFVVPIVEEGFDMITFYDMHGGLLAIDYGVEE